jgi:hypothetical protein
MNRVGAAILLFALSDLKKILLHMLLHKNKMLEIKGKELRQGLRSAVRCIDQGRWALKWKQLSIQS